MWYTIKIKFDKNGFLSLQKTRKINYKNKLDEPSKDVLYERGVKTIECKCCKEDTIKRVVIKRKPLEKTGTILPDGYQEYHCKNIIKCRRVWCRDKQGKNTYKWIIEECRNNILVKLRKRLM